MRNFGQKFKTYQPFAIEHLAIPSVGGKAETKFLKQYGLNKDILPEIMPMEAAQVYKMRQGAGPHPLKVISKSRLDKIKKEFNKVVVGIAPTAHVYQIPANQPDLATPIKKTMTEFNYYVVELSLNVMLGQRFKIPELLFELSLESDSQNKTDVTAYDMVPDDTIKHVKVVGGKLTLGINKLLKFIPSPVGQIVSDLIAIEINPWEFEWGFDKYSIDACGRKNYHLYWKIYKTDIVQGFNPTMILKVQKNVKKIFASAKCIYKLKTNWWDFTPDVKTKAREIKIWAAVQNPNKAS